MSKDSAYQYDPGLARLNLHARRIREERAAPRLIRPTPMRFTFNRLCEATRLGYQLRADVKNGILYTTFHDVLTGEHIEGYDREHVL